MLLLVHCSFIAFIAFVRKLPLFTRDKELVSKYTCTYLFLYLQSGTSPRKYRRNYMDYLINIQELQKLPVRLAVSRNSFAMKDWSREIVRAVVCSNVRIQVQSIWVLIILRKMKILHLTQFYWHRDSETKTILRDSAMAKVLKAEKRNCPGFITTSNWLPGMVLTTPLALSSAVLYFQGVYFQNGLTHKVFKTYTALRIICRHLRVLKQSRNQTTYTSNWKVLQTCVLFVSTLFLWPWFVASANVILGLAFLSWKPNRQNKPEMAVCCVMLEWNVIFPKLKDLLANIQQLWI